MDVMLGLDVGGTKIAVGSVAADGLLLHEPLVRASGTLDDEDLLASIVAAAKDGADAAQARGDRAVGLGIACAGTVDVNRGVVVESPNLPLVDFPVRGRAQEALGLPVLLDNDATLAVYAEAKVGAAVGRKDVVMLTLGTGIGGGLYLDGRLYRGATGAAAELGHMIVAAGGDVCRCGNRGCLEAYASGTAFGRVARRLVERSLRGAGPELSPEVADLYRRDALSGEAAGELARRGDELALAAVHEVAEWLGIGLASYANIFNPQMIVVGGGLGTLGELLLAPARRVMREYGLSPNRDVVTVASASLGNSAGALGAGLAAWEELVPSP